MRAYPWPVEWLPVRVLPPGVFATPGSTAHSFVALPPTVCAWSGARVAHDGNGCLCARCGTPITTEMGGVAHAEAAFDPPACPMCFGAVRHAFREGKRQAPREGVPG